MSILTLIFIFEIEKTSTNNYILLLSGIIIFSLHIRFSQLSLNELNKAAYNMEKNLKTKVMYYVYYFSMGFRILGMLLVYFLSNYEIELIQEIIIFPKKSNLTIIILSCLLLVTNIFTINKLHNEDESE